MLKKVKRVSQTADIRATIHKSYELGHSLAGAIEHLVSRYPGVSSKTLGALSSDIYSQKDTLSAFFSGNLGQIANPYSYFCPQGQQPSFNVYITVVNKTTGQEQPFWIAADLKPTPGTLIKSSVLGMLYSQAVAAAFAQNYDAKQLPQDVAAKDLLKSGALKISSWDCK